MLLPPTCHVLIALGLSAMTVTLFTPHASAQMVGGQWETQWQFDGTSGFDNLGRSVSGAGDVDGDGFDDVVVGTGFADSGGLPNAGCAFVYSGATGNILWQFNGQAEYDYLGDSVSGAGDVDGDGFADLIIGAPEADSVGLTDAGSAFVYSGATGSLLWQFDGQLSGDNLGISVSGAGDVDGDGFDDLIVGAHVADPGGLVNAGAAYVFSGATGFLLWQFNGQSAYGEMGYSVSGAGDVDGDGFDDTIVGARKANPGGRTRAGSVYVFSGANGSLLWQFDGLVSFNEMGNSVSDAGDVDGDGYGDLIVGASLAHPSGPFYGDNAGSAYVYSGANGSLLWQFDGQGIDDRLGFSVSSAGDVDLDGFDDVIVGAIGAEPGGMSSAGSAYIYSGATSGLLWQFDGPVIGDIMGMSVSGADDVDGDGLADVIVGAPNADPGGLGLAGSAYVYSLDSFLHTAEDTISYSGPHLAQLNLSFPPSEAGMPYTVLFSLEGTGPSVFQGLDIPLTQDSHFQLLLGNPNLHGVLDASAEAQLDLGLHNQTPPGAIGHTFHLAAVTLDPGAWTGRMSSVVRYLQIVP